MTVQYFGRKRLPDISLSLEAGLLKTTCGVSWVESISVSIDRSFASDLWGYLGKSGSISVSIGRSFANNLRGYFDRKRPNDRTLSLEAGLLKTTCGAYWVESILVSRVRSFGNNLLGLLGKCKQLEKRLVGRVLIGMLCVHAFCNLSLVAKIQGRICTKYLM